MSGDNLQLIWAERLIATLVRCGVRRAVISPGSRSTPLTLAAASHPGLTAVPVVDERSAAFFALGLARVERIPPLLICTSGTAAAHYLPAVIEASLAGVPLLVLSADRPPEEQQRGAAQTIDQRAPFAAFLREQYDLGPPDAGLAAQRGLAATATRAVARACGERPGPVQLNVPLRKPLEPQPPSAAESLLRGSLVTLPGGWIAGSAQTLADEPSLHAFAAELRSIARGLVVAGPAPLAARGDRAAALAAALGWPLIADRCSQRRGSGATALSFAEWLLRTEWADQHAPEGVLVIGCEPGGIGWSRAVERWPGCRWLVVAPTPFPDPNNRATAWLRGDVGPSVARLADLVDGATTADPAWLAAWQAADRNAATVSAAVSEPAGPQAPLDEPAAVRISLDAVTSSTLVMLGNSLPVRSADLFAPPGAEAGVLHQRGAHGIDGLIAGAAGAAQAHGSTLLLLGDVALRHDLGSLALLAELAVPLTVVVLDNRGGRIFEQLPLARDPRWREAFERFFLTPAPFDLAAVCGGFGLACTTVSTAPALQAALQTPAAAPRVVIAKVNPNSAAAALERGVLALEQTLATAR